VAEYSIFGTFQPLATGARVVADFLLSRGVFRAMAVWVIPPRSVTAGFAAALPSCRLTRGSDVLIAPMIIAPHRIGPSLIPGANNGLFLTAPARAGQVLEFPDGIERTWSWPELLTFDEEDVRLQGSVRLFEDRYICPTSWDSDCLINHSAEPNGLWLLGYVFAARDIEAGEELTIDYRLLLTPEADGFVDNTGCTLRGMSFAEAMRQTCRQLAELFANQVDPVDSWS
jgi:hypothetical protein